MTRLEYKLQELKPRTNPRTSSWILANKQTKTSNKFVKGKKAQKELQ